MPCRLFVCAGRNSAGSGTVHQVQETIMHGVDGLVNFEITSGVALVLNALFVSGGQSSLF